MAGRFPLIPQHVPPVRTAHRRIVTPIPAPQSLAILERLRAHEPVSMTGQPPIVWDRAEGIHVFDAWGNQWLDWSSGVLVTNAGHGDATMRRAMIEQIEHGLLHNYCFASDIRARLVELLCDVAPEGLKKAFLLTTGSEATEVCIKLMRTHGLKTSGGKTSGGKTSGGGGGGKIGIVTFGNAFHGRTMGAQMAGGIPALKNWIVNLDPAMVQVPFPDGFRQKDVSFDVFLRTLDKAGVTPNDIAGVMTETYQGGSAAFAPPAYMQRLRAWCDEHDVVLTFDEVQAGFGRTGTFWGFEHYGVTPDLVACGKGISSGMPLSAVIGRPELLDQYPPGSMTSTHTGNPVCCAAAIASITALREKNLVENAAKLGKILDAELKRMVARFGGPLGAGDARGLVGTLQIIKPASTEPDPALAADIVRRCYEQGLLMFAPVGVGGGTVKIAPPLVTDEAALREGIEVLESSIAAVIECAK